MSIHERVDAFALIEAYRAHGLFAHRALVGIAGRLIVVGEGHEGRAHAQKGERLDFAVGRHTSYNLKNISIFISTKFTKKLRYLFWVDRNVGIIFFIYIKKFNVAPVYKVGKGELLKKISQLLEFSEKNTREKIPNTLHASILKATWSANNLPVFLSTTK